MQKEKIQKWKNFLTKIYSNQGEEICGVITASQLVALQNVSPSPELGFDLAAEDVIEWMDKAWATWHTHPNMPSNLSGADYNTFMAWPDHYHFISGADGVRCYKVCDQRKVLLEVGND